MAIINFSIEGDDISIIATVGDKEVGYAFLERIQFPSGNMDYSYILENIDVIEGYQKSGIGSEMLSEAFDTYENILIPRLEWLKRNGKNKYCYTDDGAAFMESCLANGTVREHHFAPATLFG